MASQSSKEGKNLFVSALLFLVGISLALSTVSSFTKSYVFFLIAVFTVFYLLYDNTSKEIGMTSKPVVDENKTMLPIPVERPRQIYTYQRYQTNKHHLENEFASGKIDFHTFQREQRSNYFTWGKGAGAEMGVQRNLEKNLQGEYQVIPDFQTGMGNIDILVITLGGIYCIEVKSSKGIISYENGRILLDGTDSPRDYLRQVCAQEKFISRLIPVSIRRHIPIIPVLEVTRGRVDRNTIHGPIQGKVWVGGFGFSLYLIRRREDVLPVGAVQELSEYFLNREKRQNVQLAL